MDNPEKLATLSTQNTRRRQTKQNKKHNTILCVGHNYIQITNSNSNSKFYCH
jgi:hypothetical protein